MSEIKIKIKIAEEENIYGPGVPSKDFSWIILGSDHEGILFFVDASQGFHDTDMLGSCCLMDLIPEESLTHANCIFKVRPSIDTKDCSIDWYDHDVEVLFQYKRVCDHDYETQCNNEDVYCHKCGEKR